MSENYLFQYSDRAGSLDSVVRAQRSYFRSNSTKSIDFRLQALQRLELYLIENRESLLDALEADLGKPNLEAFLAEYFFLLEEVRLVQKSLKKWWRPKNVSSPVYFQPCRASIQREAFGVVLIMAPWNYPIQLALSPLIAALAAGNTVVLKPSELTPSCESWLERAVDACFTPEYVSLVKGGKEVAEELLDLKFDFIFFTGSTQIGRVVASKAAVHLTPSVLELGGKCPCIVDATVDLSVAAKRILTGKFFNAGQTCFAPDFVAVQQEVREAFIDQCRIELEAVPWKDEMARIVDQRNYQRLIRLIEGECIQSGEDEPSKNFLSPRVLPYADWSDAIMKEEVFGPVLPVVSYNECPDLLGELSAYGSPLACYLFSKDQKFVDEMMDSIPSGAICVNDTMKQGSHLGLPFGGVGDSGYGRYRGKAGVDALSYERAIVRRGMWSPKMMDILPPYERSYKILQRFMGK